MIQVGNRVHVGTVMDAQRIISYGQSFQDGWAFIHCCKEPWHRQFVGYTGVGCPKDSPEYLYAIRDNAIALNMVDVDDPDFFAREMVVMGIAFAVCNSDKRLLFSCNQGESRSPCMAMLYLAVNGEIPNENFRDAELAFMKKYMSYNPKHGIRMHLKTNWEYYLKGVTI